MPLIEVSKARLSAIRKQTENQTHRLRNTEPRIAAGTETGWSLVYQTP